MATTIHFYEPTEDVRRLSAPETHRIEIRSSQDADRYVLVIQPLALMLGSIKELPITLYSVIGYRNENRFLMLDPLNMVWEVDGVDSLKVVRHQLGMS